MPEKPDLKDNMIAVANRIECRHSLAQRLLSISALALVISLHPTVWANDLCDDDSGGCIIDNGIAVSVSDNITLANRRLYVGRTGVGTLHIIGGGQVNVDDEFIQVGLYDGAKGSISVKGKNAMLTSGADMNFGVLGIGELTLDTGGSVITGRNAKLGNLEGGEGIATVSRSGSWTITDFLYIGDKKGSTGTLTINTGGLVSVSDIGRETVYVANDSGSAGTINIGAASGETAIEAGTLDSKHLVFGEGEGKLVFNHIDNSLEFKPAISGSGTILHENGFTILTGDNSDFSGTTTINGGTLQIGGGATMGTLAGDVSNNGTLAFNRSDNIVFEGIVSGSGALTKTGIGTLTLTGNNTYTGGTEIEHGTLQIGDGGTTGYVAGDVSNNGMLAFSRSDNITFDGLVSGSGDLGQIGPGTLTLTGNNTYTGDTQLLGGTLSVSEDDNLGGPNGGLAFNGGVLQIMGESFTGTDRSISWGDYGGGFDIVYDDPSDNHVFTVSSDINGNGNLLKRGAGALRLTGSNAYGNTLVQEGDLYGDAQSISGDVHVVDGGVFFEQDSDAAFAGNFSSDDQEYVTAFKSGEGVLTLTGGSSLNWWIEEGELATSAERFTGYAGLNTGGTLTFNQNQDATFHNTIEGIGQFNKTGPGTLYLTGNNAAFLGTTTISDGTLSVGGPLGAGALSSKVNVADGGTLAGNGIVGRPGASGQITVASGGTIAPGNSIGTLVVNGDLVLEHGSRYLVEVDPDGTSSDLIDVAGTAALDGGSVVHIGADGAYRPQASYRILSAGTGLIGAFGNVSSDFAFLTPDLVYDYDDYTVDLTLQRNNASFASLAHTPNQIATAQGLESLPQSSELLQRILTLPEGTPAAAFDALSGEVHATTASAIAMGSATARALPLGRLRASLAAGQIPGAPLAQAGGPLPASAMPQSGALPLWAEVIGSWQHMNSDGNASALKQSTGGVFLGGDLGVGQGWRLGVALGYTDSRIRVDDRDSKADVTSYSATLYGGKAFDLGAGQLNLLAGGAYSWHDIETTRQAAVADWSHTLKADYRAHTHQLFAELGYALPVGRTTVEPFAGLAWTKLRTRGFTESGGPTGLSGQSQSDDLTTSTLGLRAGTHMELGKAQARLHATLGWRHAFGRVAPQRTMRFEGGQPFMVAGTPIARDSAVVELGADVALSSKAKVGLAYNGQLGGGNRDHAGKVNVQWRF